MISGNSVNFYASMTSFYDSEFNLYFYNCNFSNNYGNSIAAVFAAFHFYGLVFFNQTLFQNNTVEINTFIGGAIAIVYGDPTITILYFTNCIYINNYSSNKGGVFAILFGNIYDYNSYYCNNSSPIGGSVFISGYSDFNLTNATVVLGNAGYGGVLRIADATNVFLSNSQFISNTADEGACFSLEGFQMTFYVNYIFF